MRYWLHYWGERYWHFLHEWERWEEWARRRGWPLSLRPFWIPTSHEEGRLSWQVYKAWRRAKQRHMDEDSWAAYAEKYPPGNLRLGRAQAAVLPLEHRRDTSIPQRHRDLDNLRRDGGLLSLYLPLCPRCLCVFS